MKYKMMKTIFLAFVLVFVTVSLYATETEKKKEGDYVAKVNGATISRKDYDRAFANAKQQFSGIGFQQDGSTESSGVNLEKEVLDRLIDIELMLQDSEKRSVAVKESDLDNYFNGYKERFTEENQFKDFLEKNGLTEEELKEQFHDQLIIRRLQYDLRKELAANVKLEDKEIKAFYDKNTEQFKQPEQIKAGHILIPVTPEDDEEKKQKARKTIEGIKEKISAGGDFSELARTESQCPSSAKGGDLGFFSREQVVAPFADAAFALKPGEMSDIVETEFGYHLIKVEEKKDPGTAPYEEVKEDIEEYLIQARMEQAQQDYLQGLRDKAEIKKF